jgi:uncharacterized protein (TIGR03083 family)
MMPSVIDAIRADRDALVEICSGLDGEQWAAPSGCPGWSVQDLVTHQSNTFWATVDPGRLPDTTGVPFEQAQDIQVKARRGEEPCAVLADYKQVSENAFGALAALVGITGQLTLGDAGTYPLSALPAAYAFDHYIHIRGDLFAPRGPLTGLPPPSDELRVGPALEWIAAALPQQNPAAAGEVTLEFEITGTGARSILFGSGPAHATVRSAAEDFVRWITQRGSWDEFGVHARGDEPALATARTLRVF